MEENTLKRKLTAESGNSAVLVEIAEKEAVDEGRLAEASLTHHHQCEVEPSLDRLAMYLLRQRGEPDVVPVSLDRTHPYTCVNYPYLPKCPTASPPASAWKCFYVGLKINKSVSIFTLYMEY